MSDLRHSYHQKSRSWGSFNRQSRQAKQRARPGGDVQESKREFGTKPRLRSSKDQDTPPRMATRRKSEGDRRIPIAANPNPKCLPALGHSSPRTVIRPSILCSPLQKDQFMRLDDDTYSTMARSDPKAANTNNMEHYSQIWLSNYKEDAKKKWGVSARTRKAARKGTMTENTPVDCSAQKEDPRRCAHRSASKRTSILDNEMEQLARALHQIPTEEQGAQCHLTNDRPFDEPAFPSAVSGESENPVSDFPFSADFRMLESSSAENVTLEEHADKISQRNVGASTCPDLQAKTFAEKEMCFEQGFNLRDKSVPPRRLPLDGEEALRHDTSYIHPSIFRLNPDSGIYDAIERGGEIHTSSPNKVSKNEHYEEKKKAEPTYNNPCAKQLKFQTQALFRPEDLDFYKDWVQHPRGDSNGASSFDEHLAQLKLDNEGDIYREQAFGPEEIVLQQHTFSGEESNLISEITETFSSEDYLNQFTKERETILQQNGSACRKAKCHVFYNKLVSKSEEKSSEEFPPYVKGMVGRLEALDRLEADFAEEFGYKDFIPIQEQKKKEANLRLRLLKGYTEDAFTDGDEALDFMIGQSFSSEDESTVVISPFD